MAPLEIIGDTQWRQVSPIRVQSRTHASLDGNSSNCLTLPHAHTRGTIGGQPMHSFSRIL